MDDPRLTASPVRAAARLVPVLPWLLFALALCVAAFFALKWQQPQAQGDPLATSLVAFQRQERLVVFSAEMAPVVASNDSRMFGLVNARQVAVIPARVDYAIDLAKVGRDRLSWSAPEQKLTVRLPPLSLSRPNLDEARAQYLRDGIWITREAQDKLTRENTRLAETQAAEQAASPVLMDLAREAASSAIARNLAIPLQVAGFGKAQVVVEFDR